MMKNAEIKRTIWESRFRQYEIAEEIGISEYTFCRWFRREANPKRDYSPQGGRKQCLTPWTSKPLEGPL